jgi:hypothetical protein
VKSQGQGQSTDQSCPCAASQGRHGFRQAVASLQGRHACHDRRACHARACRDRERQDCPAATRRRVPIELQPNSRANQAATASPCQTLKLAAFREPCHVRGHACHVLACHGHAHQHLADHHLAPTDLVPRASMMMPATSHFCCPIRRPTKRLRQATALWLACHRASSASIHVIQPSIQIPSFPFSPEHNEKPEMKVKKKKKEKKKKKGKKKKIR